MDLDEIKPITYKIIKYTYLEEGVLKNFFKIYNDEKLSDIKYEEVIISTEIISENIIDDEIIDHVHKIIDDNTIYVSMNDTLLYNFKEQTKNKILSQQKEEYYEKHKVERAQKQKEYKKKHKDEISQKQKEYKKET